MTKKITIRKLTMIIMLILSFPGQTLDTTGH